MTSLCTKYYQFILAQGILGGFASGMLLTPALAAPGQYFRKKRALAMGITVAGSSIGGVVFPILLNHLFNSTNIGFGWSVRIIGFVNLALLGISCATIRERLPNRRGPLFIWEAFKHAPYVLTVVGLFGVLWGMYTPFFFLVDYASLQGMSSDLSFDLLSILNAASFFGRIGPGLAADKLGRFNVMVFMDVATAIVIFCWTSTHTNISLFFFAAVFGFVSGAVVSLFSAIIIELSPTPNVIGSYLGMAMFCVSIAGLTGPPINGAIIAKYGGFEQAVIFSGVVVLVGALCIFAAELLLRKERKAKAALDGPL